jgi:stringent starvation protein B
MEYVKNGEIVLNLAHDATHKLTIGNDLVQFAARFNGVSRECSIPIDAVLGVFARENGQGLFFPAEPPAADGAAPAPAVEPDTPASPTNGGKPKLQVVK